MPQPFVIKATVSVTVMDKQQVVARYKSLSQVEQAFRNLKTVSLEMRPMYHKTDERIGAHVFLCMLAYYLQWHLLDPALSPEKALLDLVHLTPGADSGDYLRELRLQNPTAISMTVLNWNWYQELWGKERPETLISPPCHGEQGGFSGQTGG